MIETASEQLNEVRWSLDGWLVRLAEQAGNYPPTGFDGGGSKGTHSDPTLALVGKRDPGLSELAAAKTQIRRAFKAVGDLHDKWDRGRAPKPAPERLTDPGCEGCTSSPAKLPNGAPGYPSHFCPTHCSVDIITKSRKGKEIITESVRVCSSCYSFWRKAERLPDVYEIVAHIEGRRRKRTA
jgi:hypothetical protein